MRSIKFQLVFCSLVSGVSILTTSQVFVLANEEDKTNSTIGMETPVESPALQEKLQKIAGEYGQPGMWAARFQARKGDRPQLYFAAATGLRKTACSSKTKFDDRIHLGSCTKAMTACLIAQAVSKGELAWDDRLGELLSDHDGMAESTWKDVTVLQLMRQRSGCPKSTPWHTFHDAAPNNVVQARRLMVDWLLKQKRPDAPGYRYSNLNYALLGHILERKSGQDWETLIVERLFKPLGIKDYGFGPVGMAELDESDRIAKPWGHVVEPSIGKAMGRAIAAALSSNITLYDHLAVEVDNAPPLGPAGRVNMPVAQWCKFIRLYLNEAAPSDTLGVSQANWDILFDPGNYDSDKPAKYAGGWIVTQREWADGLTLMHNGSNTTWYCVAWVAPKADILNVAATNCFDPNAAKACDRAIGALFKVAGELEQQASKQVSDGRYEVHRRLVSNTGCRRLSKPTPEHLRNALPK